MPLMADWNDYRHFLAVADTGSLSGAARLLGVSQPTVGRRIEALEQSLDARLFDRLSHGYALTSAGESIRELAERMEREALGIERRISGENIGLTGRVTLATAEALGMYWLAPRMATLKAAYPDLELDLRVGMALADILRREADVALRVGQPGSEELIGRRLCQVSFGLYASADYVGMNGSPRSLAELNAHRIIESSGAAANLVQARSLREAAPAAAIALTCDNLYAQIATACTGLGVAALPNYAGSNLDGLVHLLAEAFEPKLDLWLLTHQDLRHTARVRAVMDWLGEQVGEALTEGSGFHDLA